MTSFSEDRIQLADALSNTEVAEGKTLTAYPFWPTARVSIPSILIENDAPAFTAGQTNRTLRAHYRVIVAVGAVNQGAAEQQLLDYANEIVIALINEGYTIRSVGAPSNLDLGDGQKLTGCEIAADHNLSLS